MSSSFPRTLSLLRQERNISQRAAASDLKISQALLSHYENGVREPGLDFVLRASEYYSVSTDFLLGRSMSRDGFVITADELKDASGDRDNVLRGSVLATLNKKLLINSVSIIFDLLGSSGNRALVNEAAAYMGMAVYKLFRHIYTAFGKNAEAFFSVPPGMFGYIADADMRLSEAKFTAALNAKGGKHDAGIPEISNDTLSRDYPATYQSILNVVHAGGERLRTHMPDDLNG